MKLAFLYAGQGSQTPGMGRDFYETFPEVRDIFEAEIDGHSLRDLCFEAPAEVLALTRYTQPCMGAFAAVVTRLLTAAEITPSYAAGLSLGEYGALHAAGVYDSDTLTDMLIFRGRAMDETTRHVKSAMTAVFGLEETQISDAIAETGGEVYCCNFNCPGQIVIGGAADAVAAAEEACKARGAKRCIPLNVSGPFHTPLMDAASVLLREKFANMTFERMRFPVLFNATGGLLPAGRTVAQMLELQVRTPVRFEQNIRTLAALGVDTVIEIGPGKVLSGIVRKVAPQIRCMTIGDVASYRDAVTSVYLDMVKGA